MTANIKISILAILSLLILGITLLSMNSTDELVDSEKSFHKLNSELHIIKNIKSYYGEPKQNKRKLTRIISSYGKNVVFQKEDKNSIEFRVSNLNNKKLNSLIKSISNGGFKVLNIEVLRTSSNKAEFSCKVLF